MKAFKKLVPALCLLLVSAVLMGTSTYAWLAMNTEVKATGMKVKLNSDNVFLQIAKISGAYTDPATTADFQDATITSIRPATPALNDGKLKQTDGALKDWGYATSTDPAQSQGGNATTSINNAKLNEYVYSKTVYVKLALNSTVTTANNLVISGVEATVEEGKEIKDFDKCLRVAVCGANGAQIWTNTTGTWAADGGKSDTAILSTVTTTEQSVTIYIWYEGTDDNCKTNNVVNLSGYTFTVKLSVSEPAA